MKEIGSKEGNMVMGARSMLIAKISRITKGNLKMIRSMGKGCITVRRILIKEPSAMVFYSVFDINRTGNRKGEDDLDGWEEGL